MRKLDIKLFGRFEASVDSEPVQGFESAKEVELLCFLLANVEKYQSREKLASMLWGGSSTTSKSKSYLRKSLWRLQQDLNSSLDWIGGPPIEVDTDWIILRNSDQLKTDVQQLEQTFTESIGVSAEVLSDEQRTAMQQAVALYRDNYLTEWYFDWCIFERHRLEHMYLVLLDRLMDDSYYCGRYEDGLQYGMYILRVDEARELTHRRMMTVYVRLGDRTGSLRQYEWCKRVLKSELDVPPSNATEQLFQNIRDNKLADLTEVAPPFRVDSKFGNGSAQLKPRLLTLRDSLVKAQEEVQSTLTKFGTK